jgi:hypothetical protein
MTLPGFSSSRLVLLSFATFLLLSIACSACKKTDLTADASIPGDKTLEAANPLLKLLTAEETGLDFQNTINETFEMNITTHINTSNGGGVAILDANKDGLPDVYLVSSSGENKFYVNEGNMKFRDETSRSGLSSADGFEVAVTTADVNADGWLDIYVCRGGPIVEETRRNKLFINNGDLTFTERSKEYGLDDMSASMGASFFDYDNDGDLDLYLLNYPVDFGYTSKVNVRPTKDGTAVEPILDPIQEYDSDRLYRNDGPPQGNGKGGFTDVSKEAGIWNFAYGLSVSIEDFNQDGWMDVYVSNDFIQPDFLYINNKNGTFTNRLGDYFKHTSQHTMGTDLADFDNDGLFDLLAVDMMSKTQYRKKTLVNTNSQNKYNTLVRYNYFEPVVRNVLQRNNGNGTFSDVACMANIFETDWSWNALLSDMDNDGWKDVLITNGYQREVTDADYINFVFQDIKAKGSISNQFADVHDFLKTIPQYKTRDFIYRNRGDWTFEDMSGNWMTMPATWSNGAATADLDRDGDLDYIVNNIDDPIFCYQNLTNEKTGAGYLQIACEGPSSNTYGIGTKIRLTNNGQQQYGMVSTNRGIFSAAEHLLHFGLGDFKTVEKIEITWPDGKKQVMSQVPGNQLLVVRYTDAKQMEASAPPPTATLFADHTKQGGLNFRHIENDYIDFEFVFMLPWALSDLGPLVDTADINLDGLTDIYIGNSFGKQKGLFIQTKEGHLQRVFQSTFDKDSIYEDHAPLFFDADLDGDKDLFLISGGYESPHPAAWQCRLYINERDNGFKHAPNAIPLLPGVCLRAVAYDIDNDQDLDIVLGGRVSPGKYPAAPASYILRNDRNQFVDATATMAPEWSEVGMVSDLKIANIDADPEPELIAVGEWMPVTVFDINNGKLVKAKGGDAGFENSNGFWNTVEIMDLDGDGDQDIITGNLGQNSPYKPTTAKPIQCFYGDYDQNGSVDPIVTYFEGDNCYPMVQKDVLIKQLPVMKKKFVYSKDYAVATIEDILSDKQRKESTILKSYMVESGWWENNAGKFSFHPFPSQAQASPVQAMILYDFNKDGKIDIFAAGNKYRMEVETGRLDSGIGVMLLNNGNGGFTWSPNIENGLWAQHDARDLALLRGKDNKTRIVIANNNQIAQLYIER